jgi:DNA polymerase IV
MKKIIHIDMDAFFAAVEIRDNPKLIDKPVIVGGLVGGRGVVSTCSYEARKFGIHSAMAMKLAKKLCPEGFFLNVDMQKYKKVSRELNEIFLRYTLLVEPLSLDEAYLDVTELDRDPFEVAFEICRTIKNELLLTASAGVAYNKFLAKLGSEQNKPNGIFQV